MKDSEEHIWYDVERKEWVNGHDLAVYLPIEKDVIKLYTIPEGFTTDLASIPRIFWSIIAPHELGIDAPLIHDWLYRNNIGGRAWADYILLHLMRQNKVPYWKRKVVYGAVRAFGWRSWNRHAKSASSPK